MGFKKETDCNSQTAYDLKTVYEIIRGVHKYEGLPCCTTYGIRATCMDLNNQMICKALYDISNDISEVEALIIKLTKNSVSVFHFEAVIEDWEFSGTASL